MLRLFGPGARLCDGWNRREVMRMGGLGLLGAGLNLTRPATGASTVTARGRLAHSAGRGRASSCS